MRRFSRAEKEAVLKVLDSGVLSGYYRNFEGGPCVQEFEKEFARYHGRRYGIAVNSGTSALHTAMEACQVKDCRVVTTPFTFSASATSILMARGIPYFADIDPSTYCISPTYAEGISCRAMLAVHVLGNVCDIPRLLDMKNAFNGRYLIEDCSQAIGAGYDDELVGSFGDLATFSFNQTKTLSMGEGGMVLTDDGELANRCKAIRNHGEKYALEPYRMFVGYNYRMTEIQAAIGLVQLKGLSRMLKLQRQNALLLMEELQEWFVMPRLEPKTTPSWFIVATKWNGDRDKLIAKLTEKGINRNLPGQTVSKGYSELVHQLPLFRGMGFKLPVAEKALEGAVWWDVHRFKSSEKLKKELQVVKEVVKKL